MSTTDLDFYFGVDVLIIELAHELLTRIKYDDCLPLIYVSSAVGLKYISESHPELIKNISRYKSPEQIMEALAKANYSGISEASGAARLYDLPGGLTEGVLRTLYEVLTAKPIPELEIKAVRGCDGIKTADIDLNGVILKLAIINDLQKADQILSEIENSQSPYQFIEISECANANSEKIYQEDLKAAVRKAHENPALRNLYREFLGEPLGELSISLLQKSQ